MIQAHLIRELETKLIMAEMKSMCVRCQKPIGAADKTEPYTFPSDGRLVHSKCVGEMIKEVLTLMAALKVELVEEIDF
jgi:hypothetical protein